MRTTIDIDDPILRELKLLQQQQGIIEQLIDRTMGNDTDDAPYGGLLTRTN